MTIEKKFVKFHRQCSPYMAGEVGAFPISKALKLVSGTVPIGHYVKKVKGEWVPEDEGEDDDNVEQTNQDGSDEQTYLGSGDGEEGGEGGEQTEQSVPPKAAGQGRRQRAKL